METENYYLMARYYNPSKGVFISLDNDPGEIDNVLTQNGYNYTGNNPTSYNDPDGNSRKHKIIGGGGSGGGGSKYIGTTSKIRYGDKTPTGGWRNHIALRGRTDASIQKTLKHPYAVRNSTNGYTNNPANAYFNKNGSYVVKDRITKNYSSK